MKILYSHRTRSADGQYVHIRELTEALRARNHEIIMAGPGEVNSTEKKSLDATTGRGLSAFLPRPLYECAEYGYSFPAYRRLASAARDTPPDILYERYNLFFHAGVWLKKNRNLPMLLEVNAPLAEERDRYGKLALKSFARKSERAIWNSAQAVLPVTNVLADKVRAAGVTDDRITVIQNGVSDVFLADHSDAPIRAKYALTGKLVLGFTGFVRDWHGLDRVLHFMAEHERKDLHLLLVGDGPEREPLQKLALELGLHSNFTITGVVQRDAIPGHVAAFDVALQPAVVDYASPLKLFEYMGLKKAIVAPAKANIKEVLTSGRDAILFDETDGSFGAALSSLVDSVELRQKLGRAANDTVIKKDLTWEGNARRVERIAENLLNARRG